MTVAPVNIGKNRWCFVYLPASNGRLNSNISSALTPFTFEPMGRQSDFVSAITRDARAGGGVVGLTGADGGVLVGDRFDGAARRIELVCMLRKSNGK